MIQNQNLILCHSTINPIPGSVSTLVKANQQSQTYSDLEELKDTELYTDYKDVVLEMQEPNPSPDPCPLWRPGPSAPPPPSAGPSLRRPSRRCRRRCRRRRLRRRSAGGHCHPPSIGGRRWKGGNELCQGLTVLKRIREKRLKALCGPMMAAQNCRALSRRDTRHDT